MRIKEFVGKEVLSSEAKIIGRVNEVIFDEETFEKSSFLSMFSFFKRSII